MRRNVVFISFLHSLVSLKFILSPMTLINIYENVEERLYALKSDKYIQSSSRQPPSRSYDHYSAVTISIL